VRTGGFNERTFTSLLDELMLVRKNTIVLFSGFPKEAFLRRGSVEGQEFTVRALAWIIAGHGRHHSRILRERYVRAETDVA
jgi:hypothetical protein